MNGPMRKSKKQVINEYLKRVDPYSTPKPIAFDLRGYARYLKEHNIHGEQVPIDVMKMFQR